jgi:NACalpha-BTF3-like transcription factor
MENKLPTYKIKIHDKEFGLDFVSIVDDPAIMVKGIAFAESKRFEFNEFKQIIAGPAMIPDIAIFRRDEKTGYEYNVVFSKEDIEEIVEVFNASLKENKINVDHADEMPSAFIKSSWIIEDTENDKSNMYGFKLPVGTWFIETKIRDKELFLKLKDEGKTSFSVEGVFNMIKLSMNNLIKTNIKFMEAKLKDGTMLMVKPELAIDSIVYVIDAEGNETIAPEGEHTLESGEVIVLDAEGKILEIKPVAEETEEEEMASDKFSSEDIAMIFEALKPAISEMITEAFSKVDSSEEMKKQIADVESQFSLKFTELNDVIKSTPANLGFNKNNVETKKTFVPREQNFINAVNRLNDLKNKN